MASRDRFVSRRHSQGFTLVELGIVTIVIGIILTISFNFYAQNVTLDKRTYEQKHMLNNNAIRGALMSFAATTPVAGAIGRLPAPYNNAGVAVYNAVYDPGNATAAGVALTTAITQTGMAINQVNTDGTAARNVRVYQTVAGLQQDIPMYFASGPLVRLTYDFGAIYQTKCARLDNVCNPNPASGVPGASPKLTSANYQSWATTGTDGPPALLSTLPLQKDLLALSVQRLDKMRDKFVGYVRTLQMAGSAADTANMYPWPTAFATPPLVGADPAVNQGCRDGWYDLSGTATATHSTILALIGLSPEEFGLTAWGGRVEYCRDFDPTGTSGANVAPHYGALRFNKSVSGALAPDTVTVANNVVVTF